ncbi:hypothetical protein G6F57_006117 [Rhizopus arrhizus]|nr:hypothetical protein G6F26_007464 [Rhizopus arrhizus]KAG1037545.1 hypothetical protein G6F25_007125 [Rhizopus arrhizus]KAG1280744.1 hypothetical protein G6F65_006200 [Rhizopus arrhizus]KAG1391761.1 hypothetical protein G6F58_012647 [Rhizopus delemar]KAG1479494.1 hypothetical protein G6F57_006117 [Rhizopus arrhizus]
MSPSLPPTKRTRIGKREMSPTNSAGDSVTSTPEPEEGKSSRRRGTKRSEATPEPPSGRHSAGSSSSRRAGRSSSATRGAGAKRQTSKRKTVHFLLSAAVCFPLSGDLLLTAFLLLINSWLLVLCRSLPPSKGIDPTLSSMFHRLNSVSLGSHRS